MHFVGVATLGQPLGRPGASTVPGMITAGSYGTGTGTFSDSAWAETVAAITGTEGSPYQPIVMEIDDTQATVARLQTPPASR